MASARERRVNDVEGGLPHARAALAHRGLTLGALFELLVPMLLRSHDGVGLSARNRTYTMTMCCFQTLCFVGPVLFILEGSCSLAESQIMLLREHIKHMV